MKLELYSFKVEVHSASENVPTTNKENTLYRSKQPERKDPKDRHL